LNVTEQIAEENIYSWEEWRKLCEQHNLHSSLPGWSN